MRDMIVSAYAVGAEQWGSALLDATLKGVVLLVLAGLITVVLRRAPAATRHFVWTVGISALVVLPFAGAIAPQWNLAVLPASIAPSSVTPSSVTPSSATSNVAPDAVSAPAPSAATPNAPPKATPLASPRKEIAKSADIASSEYTAIASDPRPAATSGAPVVPQSANWWIIVSMIWMAGAAVLASRMVLGLLGTAMLARRSGTVEDPAWIALTNRVARQLGITRPVTLLQSPRSGIPMTWGVFYPVILLPADADLWTSERRSIVLLHELAHVRRFDALTQTIAQLATALFWINPLVWVAARQMRTERERACDDFVLSAGMRPSAYASDLLEIVQTMGSEPGMAYAALAMARRSEFEGRLLAILDPTTRRSGVNGYTKAATVVLALVLLIPLAGMRPAARKSMTLPVVQAPVASEALATQTPQTTQTAPTSQAALARPSGPTSEREAFATDSADRAAAHKDSVAFAREEARARAAEAAQPVAVVEDEAVRPAVVAGADKPRDDKETLILIVRAAAKMTSDYEKASLLIEVLEKFVPDDSLRVAFLKTTATLTGEYERQRVLSTMLAKDPLSDATRVMWIKTASGLSGDYAKRTALTQFAAKHDLTSAPVRQAFFTAVGTMSAGYDQQLVMVALLKRLPRLTRVEALALLSSAKGMSSNSSKSAVLVAVAEKIGLDDAEIRKAYIDTAGTLTSDSDYRRAMSAAITPRPEN